MESVIEVRGLALAFGEGPSATTVFSDIDLTVAAGEFLVIVGASGVGKSTLLRVLAGLIPATSGRVLLHTPADPARLPVALAFQDARLLPWRRVMANVEFGIERLAVGGKERRERAAAALDLVGLSALAQRWPHQLSGGQRQRVALARALAVQPYILLMDEPFGALDAITRESLQDELLRVWRATGKTIIFVTPRYLRGRVPRRSRGPACRVARPDPLDPHDQRAPAEIARPCRAEEGRGKHPRRPRPHRRRRDLRQNIVCWLT